YAKHHRVQYEQVAEVSAVILVLEVEAVSKLLVKLAHIDRFFVLGEQRVACVPGSAKSVGDRFAVRLHKTEVAAGLKYPVNFGDRFIDVGGHVMDPADDGYQVKGIIVKSRIEHRAGDRRCSRMPLFKVVCLGW